MTRADRYLDTPIARHVWETRYRAHGHGGDSSIETTWRRVARALAEPEPWERASWERRFEDIMRDFRFLPGGRILAGAGTGRNVTLFNCFVMGPIEDSIPGIFRALEEGALTMAQGGGTGYDFSTLRPHGAHARGTGAIASGPVPFMDLWDAMCATIQSTGARRGAMMGTLRCDHPDIEAFIDAKRSPGRLRRFVLSVAVTGAFMEAVDRGETWPLVFPANRIDGPGDIVVREWPGEAEPVPCRIVRRVSARALWDRSMAASHASGDPGVLFVDRINQLNNLGYRERIRATNPCGEVPLPPYGACDLGSINLTRLVRDPFTPQARLDTDLLIDIAATAVRLLDNAIDVSHYPLPAQRDAVVRARRIGLGITGLADALIMLGLRYGSDESLRFASETMRAIRDAAYRRSIEISEQKGCFPDFERELYLDAPFVRTLPADIRDGIARHGIRNSHLLAIAPAGSISLLAGNVSSGIEPVFAADLTRTVLDADGMPEAFVLTSHAVRLWRHVLGRGDGVPDVLSTAADLAPDAHIAMQAALQDHVDNAISKTINVPADTSLADFSSIYRLAWQSGLKGCTTFRPSTERAAVLSPASVQSHAGGCAGSRT